MSELSPFSENENENEIEENESKAKERQLPKISIDQVLTHTVDIINKMQRISYLSEDNVNVEFEVRLGRVQQNQTGGYTTFLSGVDPTFYERLINLFDEHQSWDEVSPMLMVVESMYNIRPKFSNGEKRNGNQAHVSYDDGNQTNRAREARMITITNPEQKSREVFHLEKQRIANVDLKIFVDHGFGVYPLVGDWPDARLSLSKEITICPQNLPSFQRPTHVRILSRKNYTYVSKTTNAKWNYVLSRVWFGETMAEAEQKMKKRESPVYEVEIELVCHEKDLRANYLANSILMKLGDLFAPSLDKLCDSEDEQSAHSSVSWQPCNKIIVS
jgi:hypothetical protein